MRNVLKRKKRERGLQGETEQTGRQEGVRRVRQGGHFGNSGNMVFDEHNRRPGAMTEQCPTKNLSICCLHRHTFC